MVGDGMQIVLLTFVAEALQIFAAVISIVIAGAVVFGMAHLIIWMCGDTKGLR